MWRLSPVDEKRDKSISQHRLWIGIAPRQENPVRPATAPRHQFTEASPLARSFIPQTLEIIALGRPSDEPRLLQPVDPEGARRFRMRLVRVWRDDFQIGCRTECDQCVSRSTPRVLTARSRPNAQELRNFLDAAIQVGRRIDEMIDSCQ